MNVIFLSPQFPPQFFRFCAALKARGVNVLGLGDTPFHELSEEQKSSMTEYYFAQGMMESDAATRAVAYFTWKYGHIDRIDSLNEYWLGLEAKLREDFNVEGPRPVTLETWRTKSGMARVFQQAGVPRPDGVTFESAAQVRAVAKAEGYPLVFKPNTGVGAARTFRVDDDAQLEAALQEDLRGTIVQPFVTGKIVSYDGLVDRQGRVVFDLSHEYSGGIMEVVNGRLDVAYWSRRQVPAQLQDYGRRALKAFGVTERFFHCEFFELKDGTHKALEINFRPPGGFTTDMMNYTADVSVYDLWARALLGEDLSGFTFERKFHVAHVARRAGVVYLNSHDAVLRRVEGRLLWHRPMPPVLAGAMGEEVFMLRDPDLDVLKRDIAFIQARG